MKIIIFDTETTGLPKREGSLADQPYIIQFASQTYEFDPISRRFFEIERYNQFIKPPIPIPPESTRISRISDDTVKNSPSFAEVAPRIIEVFANSDLAVAHNFSFDQEMLDNEMERNGLSKKIFPANIYDTLEGTRNLCKLPGKYGHYKAPRLMELHQFLLNESFAEAHDAEKDVEALARCVKVLLQQGLYQPILKQSDSKENDSAPMEQVSLF